MALSVLMALSTLLIILPCGDSTNSNTGSSQFVYSPKIGARSQVVVEVRKPFSGDTEIALRPSMKSGSGTISQGPI